MRTPEAVRQQYITALCTHRPTVYTPTTLQACTLSQLRVAAWYEKLDVSEEQTLTVHGKAYTVEQLIAILQWYAGSTPAPDVARERDPPPIALRGSPPAPPLPPRPAPPLPADLAAWCPKPVALRRSGSHS